MARQIVHQFLSKGFPASGNRFSARNFSIRINRVGALKISSEAVVKIKLEDIELDDTQDGPRRPVPQHGRPTIVTKEFKVKYQLIDPLGVPFIKDRITLEDLNKYRDLRGFVKSWSMRVDAFEFSEAFLEGLVSAKETIQIIVFEDIQSISAPALLNTERVINPLWESSFDLYRPICFKFVSVLLL